MAGTAINVYSLQDDSGEKARQVAVAHLRDPRFHETAISLRCRLQFGRFHDCSYLITNLSSEDVEESTARVDPWLYVFLDRSCRPETELWMFGSWEVEANLEPLKRMQVADLLSAVLRKIKSIPIPDSIHRYFRQVGTKETDPGHKSVDKDGLVSRRPVLDSDVSFWGAIHERTLAILETSPGIELLAKSDTPFHKILFDVNSLPAQEALPSGLRWGKMQPEHFALVRERTQIPRQDRTLACVESLAIYPEDSPAPIAWGFVGLDASLWTIHVEPAFRGKGLAKLVAMKLLKESMDRFIDIGCKRLGHAHVAVTNDASLGLCRSLGGTTDLTVYWLRVDLSQS